MLSPSISILYKTKCVKLHIATILIELSTITMTSLLILFSCEFVLHLIWPEKGTGIERKYLAFKHNSEYLVSLKPDITSAK